MEWGDYLRFALALVFVVGLIGLLAWGAKRLGLGTRVASNAGRGRLSVIAATAIDARHRLVLVRRDEVEHLLLLGATQDLLVESAIPAVERGDSDPAVLRGSGT